MAGLELGRVKASKAHRLDYVVWTAALWASLLNLLNFNHYPLFRPEVGIVLVVLALVGTFMGLTQRLGRPRVAFALAALFATLMIDLNASIEWHWFCVIWASLAIVGFFALDALLKIVLAASLGVLFFQSTASVTGIGIPDRRPNAAENLQAANGTSSKRPAIIHLVLDSYLGLEGMLLGPDDYQTLRAEQLAFFTRHGFQVYPRAYSRHAKTLNSLSHLFSYRDALPASYAVDPRYTVPEKLPYFADLDRRGYRISAVLPSYFDLCIKQRLTHCRKFESSALTSMMDTEMGPFDRAKVLGFTFLNVGNTVARLAAVLHNGAYGLFGTPDRLSGNRSQIFPLASIGEMDRFTRGLADLKPGEVRFAHFLLPHDPYMLENDCTVKPEADWLDEHGPGTVSAREMAYADQVRCLQRRLDQMLQMLDRTPAGRNAIVVIHGDHGSRISPSVPVLGGIDLTEREMLMVHSTLFAIRIPGRPGGTIPGTFALDELMADFRKRDFSSAPRPEETPARVRIMDSGWTPREWRSLPSFDESLSTS